MSRARHMKSRGGPMTDWKKTSETDSGDEHDDKPGLAYNAKGSNVLKEAEEKKKGGRTMKAHGGKAKHSIHRPGRKRGGAVGSDKRPLTSAAHGTDASGHKTGSAGDAEVD